MGLLDLYNQAKKKITDTVMPFEQKAVSGLGSLYQKAKGAVQSGEKSVMNVVSSAPKNISTYFNTPVQQNSLWNKVDSGLNTFSQAAQNVPKFTFDDNTSWSNPIKKLGTTIAQPILNIPSRTISGAFGDYGVKPTVSNVIKRSANAANIGLDVGGLMSGGGAVKSLAVKGFNDVAKPTLKSLVINGVKTGAKQGLLYGTGAGAMQGLQQGDTIKEQLKNAGMGAVQGGAMGVVGGAVLGGAVPAIGHGAGKVVNEAKLIGKDAYNFANPYTKKIVPQVTQTPDGWVKAPKPANLVTREAVMGNRGKYNYKEPSFIDTVKTPFVPQSGTAKFIMSPKAGMGIEDVSLRSKSGTSPIIDQKNANAQAVVQKQLENQRVASPVAEKGFVSPQAVQAPQAVKQPENPMNIEDFQAIKNNVSKQDFALYGKNLPEVGKRMFGTPTTKLGNDIATAIPNEYNQIGVLAQSSRSIEVRRDARKLLNYISDRTYDPYKLQKISDLQGKLESNGTAEGRLISSTIDKIKTKLSAIPSDTVKTEQTPKIHPIEDFVQMSDEEKYNLMKQQEADAWMASEAKKVAQESNSSSAFPQDPEMSSNFEVFKNLFNDPRVRNPQVKDAILNGDLETFRKEMVSRGIMSKDAVDNLTYSSTGFSGNDVLGGFKEKMQAEFPDLLMGKKVAENLGHTAPKSDVPFEGNPFGLQTFNKYQTRAFDLKQERIGAIGDVLNLDKELLQSGYRKKELIGKGVDEIKRIAGLLKLGYPKNEIQKRDLAQMDLILEKNVPWHSLKQYYDLSNGLKTHYLQGIDPKDLKDISPVSSGWRDMYRNLEVTFGKNFPQIKTQLLDKFDNAKGAYIDEQKKLLGNLDENIVQGLGIKKGSELSGAVQLYGEKKVTLEEIKQKFPNDWQKIVEADNWFRDSYTKLLADLNQVREANFPTHPLYPESTKQIQPRADYYRHFQEMQDGFPALKNILNTSSSIDPALALSSEHTKPKTKWLSMAQQRTGDTTTVDAVGGFLDYLKAYSYAKNIDPFIQKFRGVDAEVKGTIPNSQQRVGLAEELANKMDPIQQITLAHDPAEIKQILMSHGASDAQSSWMSDELSHMNDAGKISTFLKEKFAKNGDKIFEKLVPSSAANQSENKLNNTLKFLDEFANNLAGKTNPADRWVQNRLGRTMFKAINWLNSKVKANVILGNASSAIAQVFNIPQGVANAGPVASTKAIGDTLANIFRKDAPINQSTFLKERFFNDYSHFDTGILDNTRNFAVWMIGVGDEIGSKYIWNAQYRKALADGAKDPIRWADDQTRKMVAGRGVGEVPIDQQSKLIQLVAPFQLEVANQWHVFSDWARNDPSKIAVAKKLIIFSVASYLMNPVAKNLRGSDVSFDPLNALVEGVNSYNQEDNKGKGVLKLGGRLAGEVFSNVPGGQTVASMYPEYGTKVGDFQLPPRKDFFGKGDPTRFGSGLLATKAITDPLYSVVLPFGGQQIKKTIGGVQSLAQGYAESGAGKVLTPVDPNIVNTIKGVLFGKNALSEVSQAHDNNQMPLSAQQSEKFKLNGKDYFDSVMTNRQDNTDSKKLKEGIANGNEITGSDRTLKYAKAFGYDNLFENFSGNSVADAKSRQAQKASLHKLYSDVNIPDDVKTEIYGKIGVDKNQLELDVMKSLTVAERAKLTKDMVHSSDDVNRLISNKVLTLAVANEMEKTGLISSEDANALRGYLKKGTTKSTSSGVAKKSASTVKNRTTVKSATTSSPKQLSVKTPVKKYVRTADFTALDASLARLKAPSMVGGTAGIAKSIFGSMPRIAKAQRKGLRRVRLS